jgi:predicted nucleic acid-binding protein
MLTGAVRQQRLSHATMHERLLLPGMLPIESDTQGVGPVWRNSILTLVETEALTACDAACLELAISRGLVLATSDQALRRAASRRGVTVAPADQS